MTDQSPITAEELRTYAGDIIAAYLNYYTGRLIRAAEYGYEHTIHVKTFTVAVGATALLERTSMRPIAYKSLNDHGGLEIVEEKYPELPRRSAADWNDALDEAWDTAWFTPGANRPQDRTVFGHIELLEALGKRTARYWHRPKVG